MVKNKRQGVVGRPEWAARLAGERTMAGISQEAFASLIGKSQSAYAAYETGESEPDLATWGRIAGVLAVSPGWLAFGAGNRLPEQGDSRFWSAVEAHKDDKYLPDAIAKLARMLAEERFGANVAFIFQVAMKITREIKGVEDNLKVGELISAAVERERMHIRDGLEKIRKSLIQP